MGSLPPLDIKTNTNPAPHVVILGAGASLAAFPKGERQGIKLPLMINLVNTAGLRSILFAHGIKDPIVNFEEFYNDLVTRAANPDLLSQIEKQVHAYFSAMLLPDHATLYDFIILSLREKDLIATFNWDPFLAQAFRRNQHLTTLPNIIFLHGNVEAGICREHRIKGFVTQVCNVCGLPLAPTRLLFPVKQKDYNADEYIKSEWDTLRSFLRKAYFVTIFGYSAPTTDVEAKKLMLEEWRKNFILDFSQLEIIDIRPPTEIRANWHEFFVRENYGIYKDIFNTYGFCYPRRSCDAFSMATLQQRPWQENPFPRINDLRELQDWVRPLIQEEENKYLSGNPCRKVDV